jgi:hypothetical protein
MFGCEGVASLAEWNGQFVIMGAASTMVMFGPSLATANQTPLLISSSGTPP